MTTVYIVTDELLDRIDDAIEAALYAHEPVPDERCSCGGRNNMDGDVLHGHRLGALSEAVRGVLLTVQVKAERAGIT